MQRALITFIPLLALGCATSTGGRDVPGCYEGPCVKIGETQDLGSLLHVSPLAVIEDSRCPIEADCVWAGQVRVNVRFDIGHETFETEMTAYDPFTINGGVLTLREVAPDMSSQWAPLQPGDYSFGFVFEPVSPASGN